MRSRIFWLTGTIAVLGGLIAFVWQAPFSTAAQTSLIAEAQRPFYSQEQLLKTAVSPQPNQLNQIDTGQQSDFACILCHQDTTAEIEFASGEMVPALVDLDSIAHSVHGDSDEPLACTSCHNPNDYRSPHAGVKVADYAGYLQEQNDSCERCHSADPHLNSHPQEETETAPTPSRGQAVSCIDCHGSGHEIKPAESWQEGIGIEACIDCHTQEETSTIDPAALTTLIQKGLLGQKIDDDYCVACHSRPDLTLQFANGDVRSVTISEDMLHDSVHGLDNPWQPLTCANCHELEAYPHEPVTATSAREYTLEQYSVCEQCHDQNYEMALDSVHDSAIADGNEEAAVCTDCHGAHDTPVPDEPRERISHTCEQCHSEIFDEYAGSVHGEALLEEGNEDVPTCIECHGVHNINDPSTALARSRSPQLCADCHADERLMADYEISTDVFDTYVADFHGSTVTLFENEDLLGETNKAVCYDCHGVHNILSPDDPHAGIKNNLLETCQQCHPDATDNFSDSWTSHFRPSLEHNPLVYLINLFYKIVIPLAVGFFTLMVLTDVYRRVQLRLRSTE
ncbi:MAG: hypothetical protein GY805_27835 [Chloroflexi bacterium]|nr:hypothetical protein [Chloroflexota bacterium]